MKSFAIGIPTLNRYDLLKEALFQYIDDDFNGVEIFIIDNGKQNIKGSLPKDFLVTVVEADSNMGVAASWNKLCDMIFEKHSHALILNDDIYLGSDTVNIIDLMEIDDSAFWVSPEQWCAFIMPKTVFEKVGRFDEKFFPAYFEDNDFAYRIKLNAVNYCVAPKLKPHVYRRSQTIEKDQSINDNFQKNFDYFREKWGGNPQCEKFTVPFNRYQLTEDILRELGFELITGYTYTTIFARKFGEHKLCIEFDDDKFIYVVKHGFEGDASSRWERILETKQDVQDLVLGLTGTKI